MQFFIGISRNTQSKYYELSLTECLWEFRNDALWDTHLHVLLCGSEIIIVRLFNREKNDFKAVNNE